MGSNQQISKKRAELTRKEQQLLQEIEGESQKLERKVETIAKRSLVIGSVLLAGYVAYRGISGEKTPKKELKVVSVKSKPKNSRTESLGRRLATEALKTGLRMFVDSIKTPKS